MAELLIVIFLLLAAENAVFSIFLKKTEFLSLNEKNGDALLHGFSIGVITAASVLVSVSVFHSEGIILPAVIALVLSAVFGAYKYFIRKEKEWYFSAALIINSVASVLMSEVFASKGVTDSGLVQALVGGIGSMVAVLCFAGLKDNFGREKTASPMMWIKAAVLLIVAICAFVGFAV